MSKEYAILSVRVPIKLKKLMEEFVKKDAHINESDLVRDAVRQKIMKEAPELYRQLFTKNQEDTQVN